MSSSRFFNIMGNSVVTPIVQQTKYIGTNGNANGDGDGGWTDFPVSLPIVTSFLTTTQYVYNSFRYTWTGITTDFHLYQIYIWSEGIHSTMISNKKFRLNLFKGLGISGELVYSAITNIITGSLSFTVPSTVILNINEEYTISYELLNPITLEVIPMNVVLAGYSNFNSYGNGMQGVYPGKLSDNSNIVVYDNASNKTTCSVGLSFRNY